MSVVPGRWDDALMLLKRIGVDVALIIATGMLLIWIKQRFVHKRAPLR